jgi:hypothetical protein
MCHLGDAPSIRLLLPLLFQAAFDFLVCVGSVWKLPGRFAVTGDSMEAGPADLLARSGMPSLVSTPPQASPLAACQHFSFSLCRALGYGTK